MNFINADETIYLDYANLNVNTQIDKVCYVLDVSSSVSKLDTPYYILFVRDVNGVVMPCMIFNIDDFIGVGFKLNYLKGKYIRLNCRVREYGPRLSLNFVGYSVLNTSEELTKAFQKKIENVDSYLDDLNSIFKHVIGKELPNYFKISAFSSVHNGYSGGYVKFCWDVVMHSQATIADSNYEDFIYILYTTLVNYHSYLELVSKINLISDSDRIELVSKIESGSHKDRLVRDSVSSIIGLGSPSHIVPVIIHSTFNYVKLMDDLKYGWSILRPGGELVCGDYKLLRY